MSKTFLVAAGGTGGHIFPALAVAQSLQKQGNNIIWLGSENAMETRLVPKYNIPLETVAIKGIRGNGIKRKLALPFTLMKTISAVSKIIKKHNISAVIGFGGFVSFPAGVAAKINGIPLIIHEQNSIAGLSNRALSKIATRVLSAFPSAFPQYKDGLIGNPVRHEIANIQQPKQRFNKRSGRLNLLIIGGSLGAKVFNETLPEIIAALPANQRPAIIHQCGKDNSIDVAQRYRDKNITAQCIDFIDDMVSAYANADFIICRAGALTIAELTAAGLGSILVPFPFAVDDHQTKNAQYLVQANAALCVPQPEFTIENMAKKIGKLNREQCLQQAQNARKLAKPNAADDIAYQVLQCIE
ncbi:MAG: undecaprenyldiphospho-muramoylpentapeptide beta-N-acetylglucosaminyltransferase [Neisseriaceae bacterium]|nr:undecaprenyldiphospho-muramoylpentapeptide beta-N-acetylglucosaminyltransferase [Neisseriaceae bacterium]